ncbi:uncharacterized protein LOC132754693 [Ruditapes philippinarum]|uniref:uncharacterized protein LOC132754693 n=1 Tax=Ruditapes philippinarum TaxID=129788 RepID=UPI00295BC371|nr:uncharacterized protein LOC132754693 [Ruditapes philippinarum]
MDQGFCLLIKIAIIVVSIHAVICQKCGVQKEVSFARIPAINTLLSLDEFDTHIEGREMGEVYYALPKPAAFIPDINYKSTITKDPGSTQLYTLASKGETVAANSTCAARIFSLTPVDGIDRALFFLTNSLIQAMWSSCPTRYILIMRCTNYKVGQKICLIKDTTIGFYIHGNMNDAPLIEIIEDLFRATGVKFGSPSLEWFFSFGENTLC